MMRHRYFEAAGGAAFVVESARRAAMLAGHQDAVFVAVVGAEVSAAVVGHAQRTLRTAAPHLQAHAAVAPLQLEANLALRRERFEGHTRELVAMELESAALELGE